MPLQSEKSSAASVSTSNRSIEKKVAKKPVLPAPTTEPVDLAEMHRILEFDPKRGTGDPASFIGFGITMAKVNIKARGMTRKLLPNFRGLADDQDAIRHALGSFLLTRRVGGKNAKLILDGHERSPVSFNSRGGIRSGNSGSPGDVLMDLFNNRMGRLAALDPKNRSKSPDEVVMELYRAGKLQTRPFRVKKSR